MTQASTFVLLLLCVLASASVALAAYCVDLTSGSTAALPSDSTEVRWTKRPTSNGGRCNLQGVLKITPPRWARSVSFHMAFENSRQWSFDIGDSRTNNGWGGDSGTTTYDSEIHSNGRNFYVYRSDNGYPSPQCLTSRTNVVNSAMLIRLSRLRMYATNYQGYNYSLRHRGLFAFDTMYMGLNRVVHYYNSGASGGRTGQGLCSVCIDFRSDSL